MPTNHVHWKNKLKSALFRKWGVLSLHFWRDVREHCAQIVNLVNVDIHSYMLWAECVPSQFLGRPNPCPVWLCLEKRPLRTKLRLNETIQEGPWANRSSDLPRRDSRELSLSLYKPRRKASQGRKDGGKAAICTLGSQPNPVIWGFPASRSMSLTPEDKRLSSKPPSRCSVMAAWADWANMGSVSFPGVRWIFFYNHPGGDCFISPGSEIQLPRPGKR